MAAVKMIPMAMMRPTQTMIGDRRWFVWCQRWCSNWCRWRSSSALLFAFSPPAALLPRRSRNVYCSSLFGGFQWRRIFHNIFNNNDIYHEQLIWYYPTSHLLLPIAELSQFKRQGKVPCPITLRYPNTHFWHCGPRPKTSCKTSHFLLNDAMFQRCFEKTSTSMFLTMFEKTQNIA